MVGGMPAQLRSARTVVIAVLATLIPMTALADTLRCRSRDFRYAFCSTRQPIRAARVRTQHSNTTCIEGQTWGFQSNGIWVNHGCDATFDIWFASDRPGSGSNWGAPGWG